MAATTEAISALSRAQKAADDARRAGHAHRLNRIYLEQIRPNPYNPRRLDLAALEGDTAFQELLDSVRRHGVLQPILVRALPTPEADGVRYELVAGERRWRASLQAGLELIPAIVAQFEVAQARIATLVENIQRLDVPPLDEAEGFRQTLEELGISQKELAQLIGKPYHYVTNRMKLLNLPDTCRTALRQGQVSAQHAVTLAGFPDDVRNAFLAAACTGMSWQKLNEAKKHWDQVEGFTPAEHRGTVATLVARGSSAAKISRKLLDLSPKATAPADPIVLGNLKSLRLLADRGLITLHEGRLPLNELITALRADLRQLQKASLGS